MPNHRFTEQCWLHQPLEQCSRHRHWSRHLAELPKPSHVSSGIPCSLLYFAGIKSNHSCDIPQKWCCFHLQQILRQSLSLSQSRLHTRGSHWKPALGREHSPRDTASLVQVEQRAGKLGPRETFRAGTNHLLQAISAPGRQKKVSVLVYAPEPAQPSPSRTELLYSFPLIHEEAGRYRAGARGFVAPVSRSHRVPFPPPQDWHPGVPYTFKLHYISSAFLPGNGPCSGLSASS